MNRFARWSFAIALMPLAACASNPPPAPVAAAPAGPPPLSSGDASFIQSAAQGGMAEVQMGELALQKSKSRMVKKFAQNMIHDHTANNDQLKQLATSKGATLPAGPSDDQQKTMAMLQDESGRKFDHDYLAAQVEGHEAMLSAVQTEAASGTDPDLKSFASQTAPVVQMHLADAKKLANGGGRMMHRHHHHHSES